MNPSAKSRRISMYLAFSLPFVTLVICFILAKTRQIWTGGLWWPFFSDMGRDKPGYFIFATGLTTSGIAAILAFYFNAAYQKFMLEQFQQEQSITQVKKYVRYIVHLVMFLGMISTIGLPILTLFDTATYPAIHIFGANWFFVLQLIASILNTFVTYQLLKYTKRFLLNSADIGTPVLETQLETGDIGLNQLVTPFLQKRLTKIFRIQASLIGIFLIAFLFYVPLPISGPAPLLSIEECLQQNLGEKYCKETMRKDDTYTTLRILDLGVGWQVRAVCQVICILSLLGYSLTIAMQDHEAVVEANQNKANYQQA